MTENKVKHLEMIQGAISRMASNSFVIKGWAVTLVAGILALTKSDANAYHCLIAYIPIIAFWMLDAYYLMLEKRYRILYSRVQHLPDDEVDFSMDASPHAGVNRILEYGAVLISISEIVLYIPLALVTVLALFLLL